MGANWGSGNFTFARNPQMLVTKLAFLAKSVVIRG